jgi:hypothetical protein
MLPLRTLTFTVPGRDGSLKGTVTWLAAPAAGVCALAAGGCGLGVGACAPATRPRTSSVHVATMRVPVLFTMYRPVAGLKTRE